MVGRYTVERDNPSLNSHGLGKDPRIVILSSKPLSPSMNIAKKNPLIFQKLNEKHPENNIKIVLDNLFKENVQSLLVEGGEKTITSFINSGYFDEIHEYISPKKFNEGIPFYNGNFEKVRSSLEVVSKISFSNDKKITYKKKCLQD